MEAERTKYLLARYNNFDPKPIEVSEIQKLPDMVNAEADRMGRMVAAAMAANEWLGKQTLNSRAMPPSRTRFRGNRRLRW